MHQGSTIVSQLRPEFYDPRKAPFQASDLVLFEGSGKSVDLYIYILQRLQLYFIHSSWVKPIIIRLGIEIFIIMGKN